MPGFADRVCGFRDGGKQHARSQKCDCRDTARHDSGTDFLLRHVGDPAVLCPGCRSCHKQRVPQMHWRASPSGNPAIVGPEADRPVALRPRLSTGLPCFTVRNTMREYAIANEQRLSQSADNLDYW